MKSKLIIAILSVLLIGTNAFWLYSSMDQAVTMSYHNQMCYEYANRVISLTKLANTFIKDMPKTEMKDKLKTIFPDQESFEKEGKLNTTWLSIKLSNRVIDKIELDSLVKDWAKTNK